MPYLLGSLLDDRCKEFVIKRWKYLSLQSWYVKKSQFGQKMSYFISMDSSMQLDKIVFFIYTNLIKNFIVEK